MPYTATREIEIDMAHRITNHAGKCANIHGHRYKIEATVTANETLPPEAGSSEGMLVDFHGLKDIMTNNIHVYCDHVTCFGIDDELMCNMFGQYRLPAYLDVTSDEVTARDAGLYWDQVKMLVRSQGYFAGKGPAGEFYITPKVPTAENLAAHWFSAMENDIQEMFDGFVRLLSVTVHETPNCKATYYSEPSQPKPSEDAEALAEGYTY